MTPPSLGDRRSRRCDGILASKCLPGRIVTIDQDRKIRLTSIEDAVGDSLTDPEVTLPAHDEAVQGVIVVPEGGQSDYMTWSLGGTIKFWSLDGSVKRVEKVELEQPERSLLEPDEYVNELKTLRIAPAPELVAAGDRHGVLQMIKMDSWTASKARVHSAEIADIALRIEQDSVLVATASRDRTVQLLHYQNEISLVQTLDDHVGAVNSVAFVGEYLISASADRTVIVRQKIERAGGSSGISTAYVSSRVITLKASPTSMTFPEPDVLVIATMDRQILTFHPQTGALIDGFKALDAEREDAVILNALTVSSIKEGSGCRRILTGFSSTDKSIRVYDYDNGLLLARELGHTDGVSGMAVLSHGDGQTDRKILVSTGMDGLIMTWHVAPTAQIPSTPLQEINQGQAMSDAETPTKESILKRPPLRKVLSKMDLMDGSFRTPNSASRDPSPSRMKRKPSRFTLVPKNGAASTVTPLKVSTDVVRLTASMETVGIASPSPVHILASDLLDSPCPAVTVEESTAIEAKETENNKQGGLRSPTAAPVSLPSTPKVPNRSGKFRLRRPPSIPADLHMQSQALARRKSMGNVNEFGSIGMATEQMCRTLQAYRKKIKTASKAERLQLDEVEMELSATLKAVQERRNMNVNRKNAATENDLDK